MNTDEDFYDIGSDIDDLESDVLFDMDDLSGVDVRNLDGFEYPAMVVTGIAFKDAMRVLDSVSHESKRAFDVWIELSDGNQPVKVGKLPADSKTFIVMNYIGLGCTLYLDENNIMPLNLDDPRVIEQFI